MNSERVETGDLPLVGGIRPESIRIIEVNCLKNSCSTQDERTNEEN